MPAIPASHSASTVSFGQGAYPTRSPKWYVASTPRAVRLASTPRSAGRFAWMSEISAYRIAVMCRIGDELDNTTMSFDSALRRFVLLVGLAAAIPLRSGDLDSH